MYRGHSSMKGCGFSFYFIFYIPFLWVFLFPLWSRCFLPPAVPDHVELYGDIAQTESIALQGPGG